MGCTGFMFIMLINIINLGLIFKWTQFHSIYTCVSFTINKKGNKLGKYWLLQEYLLIKVKYTETNQGIYIYEKKSYI